MPDLVKPWTRSTPKHSDFTKEAMGPNQTKVLG